MTPLIFSIIMLVGAYLGGIVGSLTGLGGGAMIIPLLTLGFGVDFHYAIGSALVASIATSSGSASAYVKEGITNMRLGMFLEIATTAGAVIGAFLAMYTPVNVVAIIFGCTLTFSAAMTIRKKHDHALTEGSPLAATLKLNGSYPAGGTEIQYSLKNVAGGFSIMALAGVLSALLGIGSGALKVLAMDGAMKVPFRVSTTTSNFMVGVTAAASAAVYLQRGYIVPGLCFPVVIGALFGAIIGAKLLMRIPVQTLRILFSVAIALIALQMINSGFHHKF